MLSDKEYIVLYRRQVAEAFQLGTGDRKVKQREFEYLAGMIEEKSKVRLSLSTLKRLWKDDFSQLPHPATLDALVSILGFSTWPDYKNANAHKPIPQAETHGIPRKIAVPVFVGGGILFLIAGFLILEGFNGAAKKIHLPGKVPFTADKTVTTGVPNTVLFSYDVRGIEADSFFIQQSWNPRNKVSIDPAKTMFTSIYYTPGFHRAKLIINDSIVSKVRIHIKTEGWLPIVESDQHDNRPMYMDPKAFAGDGILYGSIDVLKSSRVDVTKNYGLCFYNIRDFEGVDSDNFSIETRIKNDSINHAPCAFSQLTILTEEHIFYVPLTTKGCVSELQAKLGEVYISGQDTDLSSLGCNVFEWQTLRIDNHDKNATVYLNDQPVHRVTYKKDFGKIVGITLAFNGPGAIDYLRIRNTSGELVYSDEFEAPAQ
ncbi:MAG: hypothetical protein WKF87_01905 [Chryseolinea sp.]